jgi:hypothetical protein
MTATEARPAQLPTSNTRVLVLGVEENPHSRQGAAAMKRNAHLRQ